MADPLLTFKAFDGTVVLDGATTQYIETDGVLDFHNLTLDKANTFIYRLQGGARLRINNQLTLTNGSYRHGFQGPSGENRMEVYGNLTINSGYDLGNGRLQMRGSENAIVDRNKGGRGLEHFIVNKDNTNDTVFVYATGAHGAAADTLDIWEGTIYWPDSADVDLDFGETYVQPGGTLVNSKNVIRSSGNVSYTGGQYQANNGTWLVDGNSNRTFSSPASIDFYNLTLNKGNTFIWTIAPGQVHNVQNKATFDNGSYHSNSNTFLDLYKDCEVNSGYDVGTGRVRFVGSANGSFIHNKTGKTFRRILINKSGSASVSFTKSSGTPLAGLNGDTLEVLTGVLTFGTTGADLDYSEILIQPAGKMVAPSGNASISGNFRNLGGQFDHNFGTWIWDGATTTRFESIGILPFHNTTLSKSNTFTLTVDASDTLLTNELLTLNDGRLIGVVEAHGDVQINGGSDGITGELRFAGVDTQSYSGSLSLINSLYVIDKTAGEVQLGSIMYIDGIGQVLDLRRGVIRGTDAHYVHFTDAGSWINASDLSYVAGPVYHFGNADFSFPVGDDNRYAPARLEALTTSNTMKVRYYAESADPLYPLSSTGPGIDHVGSTQYWTVNRIGGFSNVRLLLDSVAAWESGVDEPSSLVLTRWASDSMYWDTEGRGGYENGFVSLAGIPGTLDGYGAVTFASDNGNNPLDGVSPVCLKPQTLNATPGPLSALLDWSATADAIGYFFEGENLGGPGSVGLNLSTNSLPANSLDPCNPYRYRVTAVCADTTSPVSDWLDFSTTGCDSCGIPDSLRVTGITSTSATLEWNAVPSTIAYGVLGGPSSGGTGFLTTSQTFQNVGGLSPSTAYEWQVAAWCGADTSDFSALASRSADLNSEPQFTIYPNPVSDVLYVQGSAAAGETWTVVLRDLQGRVAMLRNSADTETLMLDVSELPSGAYTAELVTESNRHEARILIQH